MKKIQKIPKYNFKTVEKKWQKRWQEDKIFQPDMDKAKKPFYNLMMFPYPSAEGLHVGGAYTYSGVDAFGRFKKLQGFDVFEPIGLDGFGIHSENFAMKIGQHIKDVSKRTEKNFYRQLHQLGNMHDWSRTVETYKPNYYKWTQWLFLQMFNNDLAYQKIAKVNWCPSCKTVLSDEQVIQGQCERCDSFVEKKQLKQWFFRITKYADKLLKNLDWIDWPEDIKTNQRNWIGKSEGATIKFQIHPVKSSEAGARQFNRVKSKNPEHKTYLEVFTTRPDTLFGATYMVIAPELAEKWKEGIENWKEVEKYVEKSLRKSEQDRKNEEKNKTGVELKGIKAINPATGEGIPVWVADYVLAGYGTGAIMAVPAHDQRDWEFAKKFNLPIRQVVAQMFPASKGDVLEVRRDKKTVKRNVVYGIVKDPKTGKFLMIDWKDYPGKSFVIGGVKEGEDFVKAAQREIAEETGYQNLKLIRKSEFEIHTEYFAVHKNENRYGVINWVCFELQNGKRLELHKDDKGKHNIFWVEKSKVKNELAYTNYRQVWKDFLGGHECFSGEGIAVNSGFLDGMETARAKKEMIKWLVKNKVGKKSIDYKLRDWCVSRQRYWGPPIPIVHCEKCGTVPVPEKDLPVKLPPMEDFLPEGKGKGPLAKNEKFVRTKCPVCGGPAERETDVSDPFVDSCWYFFRYPSTDIDDKPFDKKRTKKWLPVDSYIGGKEHTVLHLLYSRFVTMVLNDLGHIDFDEPYKRFFGHGLITKDGAKMSKSKGNVVNPDDMVSKFGADTMRLYLRFLGDFSQGGDWRDSGIEGMARFLNRMWTVFHQIDGTGVGTKNMSMVDKTIKVIGEDIEKLSFNTAIARLMEYVNWLRGNTKDFNEKQALKVKETLAFVLAPMAPHVAEEFYAALDNKQSIFTKRWPKFNARNIVDETIELVVQVNGKVRDKLLVSKDITEDEAKAAALESDKVQSFILDKEIRKVIYVPGRLISIVI